MKQPLVHFWRRLSRTATLAAALLIWTPPALAGGPLQPPDGIGNPNGADYTGYAVVALFQGVIEDTETTTRFQCINLGGVTADDVVLQFYARGGPADRDPVGIDPFRGPLEVGEAGFEDTDGGITGTFSSLGIARIISVDGVRKTNPALACSAHYVSKSSERAHGLLRKIELPKKKKRRRR